MEFTLTRWDVRVLPGQISLGDEEKMSRDLNDLTPQVKKLAEAWLAECKLQGLDVLVTCTLRTYKEQDDLFAQRPKVTNAKGGQSFHNFGVALDFVPMRNGKPVWGSTTEADKKLWNDIAGIAEAVGFEWSGWWLGRLREMCHIQYTGGKTLEQLREDNAW